MALSRERIEAGKPYRGFVFMKTRSGAHKWLKNQMNRYFRRRMRDYDYVPKRQYYGYEC